MNFGNKKETHNERVGVHPKDAEKLNNMPYIETKYAKSKDGSFVIVKTVITDIKPVSYWEKVFQEEQ